MELAEYRAFMEELAEASARVIRPLFANAELAVETKSDLTPVTAADRGAEELMRTMIERRFPTHGVLGEEFGGTRTDAEYVWVLDPIDGTKSFAAACPLFGTLIALLHRGQPVLGAIHQPILQQLVIGDGHTTTLNGRSVRCRGTRSVAESTFLTTDWRAPAQHQNGPAFHALTARAKIARTWGD